MAPRQARLGAWFAVAASAAALAPAVAGAETMAGIAGATTLVTFDSATPGDVQNRGPITGLQDPSEVAIGLDLRPATGELFLMTVPSGALSMAPIRSYSVDPLTATATFVGAATSPALTNAGDRPTGMDFQPLIDRIRIVQSNNENGRFNPATGALSGNDADLTYTAPATGPVVGNAYDRNIAPGPPGTPAPAGARTTLYGIDAGADLLVTQGGVNAAGPGGPNGGTIVSVGPLGVAVDDTSDAGFDIAPGGTAYASLRSGGASALYTVNLANGTTSLLGALPLDIRSVTVLKSDNCPSLAGDDQPDLDGDGQGDGCDADIDGDGLSNSIEQAIGTNPRQADTDGDGKADGADACPVLAAATANGCPAPDLAAPTFTLAGVSTRITYKRFVKGVKVTLTPSEAASFEVALLGTARSTTLARAGDVALAERTLSLAAGTRSATLKPKRSLLGKRRKFTVRLRVTATDGAGNRGAAIVKTIRVG
ncbi:MAG: hypothetical protein QOJ12_1165 [Thermoleophilales bacterium]|nr:hypothetical protein [Thermoleophilales bacterium]